MLSLNVGTSSAAAIASATSDPVWQDAAQPAVTIASSWQRKKHEKVEGGGIQTDPIHTKSQAVGGMFDSMENSREKEVCIHTGRQAGEGGRKEGRTSGCDAE